MRSLLIAILLAACGGSGTSPPCAGLALADCRLTDGCKADLCELCTCTPQYRGCVAESAQPECPAVGCASPECCNSDANCTSGATFCLPPGEFQGCGFCNMDPSTCTDDASCKPQGATMICEPILCTCNGNTACAPGCVDDTGCDEGQACDVAAARCGPRPCVDDAGCPANFSCNTDLGCVRSTCTDDLDCDGFCVDGHCFEGRGECTPPAA